MGREGLAQLGEAFTGAEIHVFTPEDQAEFRSRAFFGSEAAAQALLLIFAGIALAVAGLVIANTFQVLIAQRARTLALLRCVGASKRQIHRSVVVEGAATGLIGAAAGIALGAGLVQIALTIAQRLFPSVPVPGVISLPWGAIALPLVAGVGVATIASLAPARRATTTPPVAALRPLTAPTARNAAGRGRLILAGIGIVGGGALLATPLVITNVSRHSLSDGSDTATWGFTALVLVGVLAAVGLVSGMILAGPFWIPRVVRGVAALLARTGPGARVAAANTVRNPRRTAATAGALVIGVTLVATVSTGAASIERSANALFSADGQPDLWIGECMYYVGMPEWLGEGGRDYREALTESCSALPSGARDVLADAEGVARVIDIHTGVISAEWFGSAGESGGGSGGADAPGSVVDNVLVDGVDPADIPALPFPEELRAALLRGEALLVGHSGPMMGASVANVTVTGPLGSCQVTVRQPGMRTSSGALILSTDVLSDLVPETTVGRALAVLAPEADAVAVADTLTAALADFADANGNPIALGGAAISRMEVAQIISVVLLVLMALLAVAVLIALIGVANTLALSVVERTREHGLLRALGLTRGQMRWMLALEGMTVAGIGAAIGMVLGVGLGWSGTYLIMSLTDSGARLGAYPWHLIVVGVGALVAGLVASALPGRRAARTPPAAALAME
jgi:putative ABC transport system permease protein